MHSINFSTPVKHSETLTQLKKQKNPIKIKLCDTIDDFFTWSGKYYVVTKKNHSSNIVKLSVEEYSQGFLKKTFKILCYMTVIIPIVVLFAKIIYRRNMDFKSKSPVKNFCLSSPKKTSICQAGLAQKPAKMQLPNPSNDTKLDRLNSIADELGIKDSHRAILTEENEVAANLYKTNIKFICHYLKDKNDEVNNTVKIYLLAIIELYENKKVKQQDIKDALLFIAEDCGDNVCEPGRLTKVQKAYNKLVGANSDDIQQILLSGIEDLKLDIINQMAACINEVYLMYGSEGFGPSWNAHFIAAAQYYWQDSHGLDGEAGARDNHHDNPTVASYFTDPKKNTKQLEQFNKMYTPELITTWLKDKVNSHCDGTQTGGNLGASINFIKNKLEKYPNFAKPTSLQAFKNTPYSEYATMLSEERDYTNKLDSLYEASLSEYIQHIFFDYDEDNFMAKSINSTGINFILKEMKILS